MDNPQAFPLAFVTREDGKGVVVVEDGMSLRDYFAAMAMQALITKSQRVVIDGPKVCTSQTLEENVRGAFDYADAMLKEREQSTGDKSE